MTTAARTRHTILFVALTGAVVAWSHFSIVSPASGWISRTVDSTIQSYERWTAAVPCPLDLHEQASIKGIDIRYPACFRVQARIPTESTELLGVIDPSEYVGVVFTVTRLNGVVRDRFVDYWERQASTPTCTRGNAGGWDVAECRTPGHRSAHILGDTALIDIDALVIDHMTGTVLSEYRDALFEAIVADVCANNDVGERFNATAI